MKQSIYWLITTVLMVTTIAVFLLCVEKRIPPVLLLEIFFAMIILFTANVSSGITYSILQKVKKIWLAVFVAINVICITVLIYLFIIMGIIIL